MMFFQSSELQRQQSTLYISSLILSELNYFSKVRPLDLQQVSYELFAQNHTSKELNCNFIL